MKQYITEFITHLKVERTYALNTQQAYAKDLLKLLLFLQKQNITSWSKIDVKHLNSWIMHMRSNGISGRSIRRNLSAIRSFLTYLVNNDIINTNCAVALNPPQINQSLPKTLSYEQILMILKPRSQLQLELRDVAMVEVLYSSGLRVSELVSLNVESIDFSQGFLSIISKGAKMRYIPIGNRAQQAITNYIKQANINHGALFVNNKGQRISVRAVQQMLAKRAVAVGIKINVHPHMLRHAAATHFLQSSHDLRTVQDFLGHKSIKSTQVYTHLNFLELAKVYDKYHPRAKK